MLSIKISKGVIDLSFKMIACGKYKLRERRMHSQQVKTATPDESHINKATQFGVTFLLHSGQFIMELFIGRKMLVLLYLENSKKRSYVKVYMDSVMFNNRLSQTHLF